jgi:Fe2+ or Zn2+ uptake regulation protein
MESVDKLIELFHRKGLRVTPQRRVIFERLAEDDSHPTANEVYQQVLAVMPEVSRTTVYNTLHELVALGELSLVEELSEEGARYDTNRDRHHHLFCMGCHTLVDISRDFADVELPPEDAEGYQVIRSQVTFYGLCQNCQNR